MKLDPYVPNTKYIHKKHYLSDKLAVAILNVRPEWKKWHTNTCVSQINWQQPNCFYLCSLMFAFYDLSGLVVDLFLKTKHQHGDLFICNVFSYCIWEVFYTCYCFALMDLYRSRGLEKIGLQNFTSPVAGFGREMGLANANNKPLARPAIRNFNFCSKLSLFFY